MSTTQERPPVVAVMGHIDHGKSSLLDYIRKSNVVAGEAGGITQHVSAYEVTHTTTEGKEKKITFLDTPGHEAFSAMRSRGADIADVAILVVAADDGVKPQTLEAYAAIQASKIPYVVAFTKADKEDANIEKVKSALLEHEIYLEGFGGSVPFVAVSSKTGAGIPDLLELILLSADLEGLTGDTSIPATGVVLEAARESKLGNSATLVIKNGSLATGSYVVAGNALAPVRFIEDFLGNRIPSATFSSPVRISGFSDIPPVGMPFVTVATKKEAEALVKAADTGEAAVREVLGDGVANLPVIIKADVAGSIPAILHELKKHAHEHISVKVIATGVGPINEGDIKSAVAAPHGVVVGFHTGIDTTASDLALRSGIAAKTFSIIYELAEYIDAILAERAPKVEKEEILGRAKVLRTFNRTGTKQVIGGRVTEGEMRTKTRVRVYRREILLGEGKFLNLQTQRVDTDRVALDTEFGAQFESRVEPAQGDILEAYHIIQT